MGQRDGTLIQETLSMLRQRNLNIKVSNYSVDDSFELDSLDRELLHEQILWSGNKLVKEPCDNYEEWFVQ